MTEALLILLLFFVLQTNANQERHYLHYRTSVTRKADVFPVFSSEVVCDDRRIVHYSHEAGEIGTNTSPNADDWSSSAPQEPPDSQHWTINLFSTLSDCRDAQSSEPHVLQRITGCELEKFPDGSEKSRRAFYEYGFDGEDFIAFDSDTMEWIEKTPKAKETKKKWDLQTGRNQDIKLFLKTCMSWISTFNNPTKNPPDVHVFVPKVSDDQQKLRLTCLATGFYPRDIEMSFRSDGSKLEHQTSSGVRPNADGSFQMRISAEIETNHEGVYDCHVIHCGLNLTRMISTVWDKAYIDWASLCPAIGAFTVVMTLLAAFVIRCFIFR